MKLIMAVSKDGYVTRETCDDMSWTGPYDKKVFQLLTSVGGAIACGSRTYPLMPKVLPGRQLFKLSTQNRILDGVAYGPQNLNWFNETHPEGWLIGGQTIARQALDLDLVDQAVICVSDRKCFPEDGADAYALGSTHLRHDSVRWLHTHEVKIGDVTAHFWRRTL